MTTTRLVRQIGAPRSAVYDALVDAKAVSVWMVPTGMTSEVHLFEPHQGGRFRISLHYDEPDGSGKTTDRTDTYQGRFVTLVRDEKVVETLEFESEDEGMLGEMTITFTLTDAAGGTELVAVHEGVPPGVAPTDNEAGWSDSLSKLAALVETE